MANRELCLRARHQVFNVNRDLPNIIGCIREKSLEQTLEWVKEYNRDKKVTMCRIYVLEEQELELSVMLEDL